MKSTDYSASPDSLRQLLVDCRSLVQSGLRTDLDAVKGLLRERDPGTYEKHCIPRIAAAALISMGPTGVDELKDLIRQAPGAIYPTAIIDTIWRAASGRRLLDGYLDLDSADDVTLDEPTRVRAKLVLDDLVIQSEEDDHLRELLFSLAWLSQLAKASSDSSDIPDFGKYISSVFRASSITLTQDLIDELASLVRQDMAESAYQRFLEERPVFLDPLAAQVLAQARLGSDLVTDFVIRLHDFRYVVVEIEKPQDSIFTRANDFTAGFTHAVGQVLDFQGWVRENVSYAQQRFPQIENPTGLVIIGRRAISI